MRKRNYILLIVTWVMAFAIHGCDTVATVEDPDLNYFIKMYGSDGNQIAVDMVAVNDGTFILLGNWKDSPVTSDIYLLRVDSEGEIIWEQRLNDGSISIAKDIEPTTDGNFIVLADWEQDIGSDYQLRLLKISPDGQVLDEVIVGTAANEYSHTVTPLADGSFIASGTTEFTATFNLENQPDPDLGDFFNYRFDANLDEYPMSGTLSWSPVRPGFGGKMDAAVKAFQRGPQEFYVFGYSNIELSFTNPGKRIGLFYFKRNASGSESEPFFPGEILNNTRINFVAEVAQQLGGGYIAIGSTTDNQGVSEIFFARLNSNLTFSSRILDAPTLYETIPLTNRNLRGISGASSITGEYGFLVLGDEVRGTGATNIWLSKMEQSGRILWSTTIGSEGEEDTGAAVAEMPDGKIVILGTMGLADDQSKMAFIKVNPKAQFLK